MSGLRERLARLIAAAGPLTVAEYMAHCLFDPTDGYYMTREPFGAEGDFTTAPEISQMFGELVAVWLAESWTRLGKPTGVTVAEIGPGRGTLMKDVLRTLGRIAPLMLERPAALIEISPRLQEVQAATLGEARVEWHESFATLPDGPLLLVGNELLDAVPMRQFVKTGSGWRERVVTLDADGNLALAAAATGIEPGLLPPDAAAAPSGAIFETAPAREAVASEIGRRLAHHGGAALLIDYGYEGPLLGDTLQALQEHAYADPLADPGMADLTSHVDFTPLLAAMRAHGLGARLVTQGEFLLDMGLIERAGRLGAERGRELQERLSSEVERLAGPEQMGTLFKAMLVGPAGVDLPPAPASGRAD